jgi:hypothetical protein
MNYKRNDCWLTWYEKEGDKFIGELKLKYVQHAETEILSALASRFVLNTDEDVRRRRSELEQTLQDGLQVLTVDDYTLPFLHANNIYIDQSKYDYFIEARQLEY